MRAHLFQFVEHRVRLLRLYSRRRLKIGVVVGLSKEVEAASWREFLLFWIGFVIIVVGVVSILLTISGVMIDVLSYRCWYPIISPLLGMNQPAKPTQTVRSDMPLFPYYCYDPVVAVIRFVFNLLAELIVIGAGLYMMLNGKKH